MNAELSGMWRGPICSPSWSRSSSATVKPSEPLEPRRPSGSFKSRPMPTTPATGASVICVGVPSVRPSVVASGADGRGRARRARPRTR
eukprot:3415196-Prymnesium_polylepis.1